MFVKWLKSREGFEITKLRENDDSLGPNPHNLNISRRKKTNFTQAENVQFKSSIFVPLKYSYVQ